MGELKVRLTTRLVRGETILFLALLVYLPGSAPHRAGLVIRFGDGRVLTRCVTFQEPRLSGLDLLTRAGLPIVVDVNSPIGAGVCKIEQQGCDRGRSCFCQCEGSTCAYWQYFHLQNGAWKYSNLGAALYQVSDGAVEGWAWGNNVAPPVMSLDQICAASETVLSATPTPRAPAPSPTPVPTTPRPPLTVTPTLVPPTTTAMASPSPAIPPTATPMPSPTLSPLPTLTPAPTDAASEPQPQAVSPLTSYAVFGVIVLGLGAWWVVQARRKSR